MNGATVLAVVDKDAFGPEGFVPGNREVVDVPAVRLPPYGGDFYYVDQVDRPCIDCGVKITRGERCRSDAARERWRKRFPPRYCKVCSGEITSRNKARAVYCSVACKFADPELLAKVARQRNSIEKTCPHCTSTFSVPVSTASRYNYCSRACSSAARGCDAVCRRCGAAFRHGRAQIRGYCSETCRRPPVHITCEHCGTSVRMVPSLAKDRRYCSARCYMASGLETSIERTVRLCLEHGRFTFMAQAQVGPWVVDFLVGERLVIEADGSYWHSLRPHVDRRKTADLIDRGYTVWRLPEDEIRDDQFPTLFKARLADHERAFGELPRLTPDQLVVVEDEHRVIVGQP